VSYPLLSTGPPSRVQGDTGRALAVIPIVHLADLPLDEMQQGTLYRSWDVSVTSRLGITKLGVSYSEVPPGKSGCPFHNHLAEDEVFVILEGTGIYRFGASEHPIKAGDVLGAPSGGTETAHQIRNTGETPLRYLSLSNRAAADVVQYPDSGKFQVRAQEATGRTFRFVGRPESELDYWDGEPGA